MEGKWIQKTNSKTVLVWVHGVLSSGEECWLAKNNSYWPIMIRNEISCRNLSNYVFTYKTGIFSGSYKISDIVDSLKEYIRLDDLFRYQNMIFICHSMGGIVVRKYLVERASDLINSNKKIGLFLIASPSLGSKYANWVSPLAKLSGHAQADALRFIGNNKWLGSLHKEFLNLKESGNLVIEGKELIEDKFAIFDWLIFFKQVVQPFAGAVYFGEQVKIPNSDHSSISKPESFNDLQHRLLVRFVNDSIENFKSKPIEIQTSQIRIIIKANGPNNQIITGARIMILNEDHAIYTDNNGIGYYNFQFNGQNTVTSIFVEVQGYESRTEEITLTDNAEYVFRLRKVIKILCVAVNDKLRSLKLDEEIDEIEKALCHEDCAMSFEFVRLSDVKISELPDIMLDINPEIIHFAGHGGDGHIHLYNDLGEIQEISFGMIRKLLENRKVNGVLNTSKLFFNSCYSEKASELLEVADTIIGTSGQLSDDGAIMFAKYFYKSLCIDYDFENAFDFAMLSLKFKESKDEKIPVFFSK